MRREWHQLSYPGVGNQALQTSRPSTDSAEDEALGLDRWRDLPRAQTPPWPDPDEVDEVCKVLDTVPPIVAPYEVDQLRERLAEVCEGKAFLLQGGDCAETFADNTETPPAGQRAHAAADGGRAHLRRVAAGGQGGPGRRAVHQAALVGRLDALGLPAYRGDMINSLEPTPEARVADPQRMIRAYANSSARDEHAARVPRRRPGRPARRARLEQGLRPHLAGRRAVRGDRPRDRPGARRSCRPAA